MKTALPFTNGFYQSRVMPFSSQRCVNMVPKYPENSALSDGALFNASGITTQATTGATLSSSTSGAIEMGGVLYITNGTKLYSINSSYVVTDLGTIGGGTRVSMAHNGTKLCIVSPGGDAYVYDSGTSTLTQITDPDYNTADIVVFKDGYFIFSETDGTNFFCSQLNDPLTFDALDFGSAEVNPDSIVGLHVNHNDLFVLGSQTIELFTNQGGSGFPFIRIDGANIQKGVHAKFSPVEFDNTFMFVGGGYNEMSAIWKVTSSSSAVKVSTDAVDSAIQEFTKAEIANAFSFTYSENGHFFACFTFEATADRIPSRTFVYDATSSTLSGKSIWFERQTGVSASRWRVNHIVNVYNRLITTDSVDGRIGYINADDYEEYGSTMLREFVTQPFTQLNNRLFFGNIELTVENGVGLSSGQGSNPLVNMEYSDNGGRDWSYILSRTLGATGEYLQRVIWRRLGRSPTNRMFRFKVSDPIPFNVLKLESNIGADDA